MPCWATANWRCITPSAARRSSPRRSSTTSIWATATKHGRGHSPAWVGSTKRGPNANSLIAVPIADDEDREIYEGDLVAEPWFGLLDPD